MKKLVSILFMVALLLTSSCDKGKSVAEETAKEFAEAVNAKDLSTANNLYPSMHEMENVKIVDSIVYEKLNVEYSKQDSLYTVKFLPGEQTVIVKVDANGSSTIENSHAILPLNPMSSKLAQATGVPIRRMNDREVAELFREESVYLIHVATRFRKAFNEAINSKNENVMWGWGRRPDTGAFVDLRYSFTNELSHPLKGEDYQIEMDIFRENPFGKITTHVLDGVDLQPRETHVFIVNDPVLFSDARSHNLQVTAQWIPKDRSYASMIYIVGDFNGNEFNEFLADYPDVNVNDYKTLNPKEEMDTTNLDKYAGELDDNDFQIPDY